MKTRVDAEKRCLMGPLSPSRREGAVRLKKERKKEKRCVWSECLRVLLIKGRGGEQGDEEWAGSHLDL